MSRTVRDANLETRSARARLKISGKPYYRAIDPGLHLGYRKGKTGGKWVARWYVGDQQYRLETIEGIADDHQDPDGIAVLSYAQAQAKAREIAKGANDGPAATAVLSVQAACEDYVKFLRSRRKTADDTELRLRKHVYPDLEALRADLEQRLAVLAARRSRFQHRRGDVAELVRQRTKARDEKLRAELKALPSSRLGDKLVPDLTKDDIESWLNSMVQRDKNDPEVERRSKDSANRVLTMLKAALNRVFDDEKKKNKYGIVTDYAWRRVKPFEGVGRARQVHLDTAQSRRLINVSNGAFRRLATAALLTGARPPHELVTPRVRAFRADLGTLSVDGKTGPRDIVLTKEAVRFFEEITAGRAPNDLLLPKDDGTPWAKNDHVRPMQEAVRRAHLPEETTLYALRHTHASQSILAGMNLQLLAENMGTSIRMLEVHYGKFIAASRRKLVEESAFRLGLPKKSKVVKFRSGAAA